MMNTSSAVLYPETEFEETEFAETEIVKDGETIRSAIGLSFVGLGLVAIFGLLFLMQVW